MNAILKKTRHPLILASASNYKKALLERLQFEFTCHAADIEEEIKTKENPEHAALRLAKEKALAVKGRFSSINTLILACDQIAFINDNRKGAYLGKPLTKENAIKQLERSSGNQVSFYTAFCLLESQGEYFFEYLDVTKVCYRNLLRSEIEDYLSRENALDCAGSAKIEGLGISLVDEIISSDPSALIGLPLIQVNKQLIKFQGTS